MKLTIRRLRRVPIVALVAVLALGAFGSALVVGAAISEPVPEIGRATPPVPAKPMTDAVSIDQGVLAVLDRSPDATDEPPAWLRSKLAAHRALAGENAALARKVRRDGVDQRDYYVVPGADDVVCVYDQAGGACTSAAEARAGRMTGVDVCPPDLHAQAAVVRGMLPNGARNVRMVFTDGTSQPLDVTDNVYAVAVSKLGPVPRQIVWDGPGVRQVSVEDTHDRC